jgi:hypothetical protein
MKSKWKLNIQYEIKYDLGHMGEITCEYCSLKIYYSTTYVFFRKAIVSMQSSSMTSSWISFRDLI